MKTLLLSSVAVLIATAANATDSTISEPMVITKSKKEIKLEPVLFYIFPLNASTHRAQGITDIKAYGTRIECTSATSLFSNSPFAIKKGWSIKEQSSKNLDLRLVIICGGMTYALNADASEGYVNGQLVEFDKTTREWFQQKITPLNNLLFN